MKKTTIALAVLPCLVGAATLDRQSALEQRAQAAFTYTVEKAKRHDRALGAAELFQAAFHFCETGRHLDQLDVHTAGTYHLWGRIMAPTPDDDSFFVSAYAGEYPRKNSRGGTILKPTVWPTGVTKSQWQWRAFKTELALPAGPVVLTLHAREDGTKIDRLFLTSDPSQLPCE